MNEDITNKVKTIIADHFILNEKEIGLDSCLVKDFGADSLDMVEIMMYIEEEFEIEIDDHAAQNVQTVRQIVTLVGDIQGK